MVDEKLFKIINHYGILPQLKYFQSELFELNEAIIGYENDYEGLNLGNDTNHIAEEIADVMVMLLQFKEYYHIDGNIIFTIMNNKIDRQLQRIEEEKKIGVELW